MHVGIIMDGNRRYAKEHGFSQIVGHSLGLKNLVNIISKCSQLGVDTLTVYALSTENLKKRDQKEVNHLLGLVIEGVKKYKRQLIGENVRVKILGEIQSLPDKVVKNIDNITEQTKNGSKTLLQICLNYGGRDEIIRSVNKAINAGETIITEESIDKYLDSSLQPDLIIRSGGDLRTSNFLPWQSVYSEYYFTDKYWPEFNQEELVKAIEFFKSKQRRFGK